MNCITKNELLELRCENCSQLLTFAPVCLAFNGIPICGSCSTFQGYCRNIIFERLVADFIFPCIYEGCTETVPWQEGKVHEYHCPSKRHKCFCHDFMCSSILLTRDDLLKHLQDHHSDICVQPGQEYPFTAADYEEVRVWCFGLGHICAFELYFDGIRLQCSSYNIPLNEIIDKVVCKVQVRDESGIVLRNVIEYQPEYRDFTNNAVYFDVGIMQDNKVFCSFNIESKDACHKRDSCKQIEEVISDAFDGLVIDVIRTGKDNRVISKGKNSILKKYKSLNDFVRWEENAFFPCRNRACPYAFKKAALRKHSVQCPYRIVECVLCKEKLVFTTLNQHCISKHSAYDRGTVDFKMNLGEKMDIVMIVKRCAFHFYIEAINKLSNIYTFTCRVKKVFGGKEDSFRYKIEMIHREEHLNVCLEAEEQVSGFIGGFTIKTKDLQNYFCDRNKVALRISVL